MVPRGLRGRSPGLAPVLLLHGLAGHAGEWSSTEQWLRKRGHVLAVDLRGHGARERNPGDVSLAAHVADAADTLEGLGLGPAVVVGQSFGGLVAIRLAAARADLVRALVVAEASPAAAQDADAAASEVGEALRRWPVPFASRDAR